MNYGLYLSASGLFTSMARLDTASANLANVSTPGFKPHMFAARARDVARVEDHLLSLDSNELLERLGAGVVPARTLVDVSPSALQKTENPLDVGIDGPGFFQVQSQSGTEGVRLTRDGRFTLNSEGGLVLATTGAAVLDSTGQSIYLDPTLPVQIDRDGVINQGGDAVAQLAVVDVPEPEQLIKEGGNLLRVNTNGDIQTLPARGSVVQGSVESSGVDSISAMMAVTDASHAASGNARLISYFDELMGRAINTLGRVS